jgi:predicted ATPase/class 3 adenylate cyclase/Tfp pilus assembly protein PilF
MEGPVALLLTDLVDSATLAQQLGDAAMSRVWAAHDRVARDLLRVWHGREIDKTDGFLIVFEQARDALGYALAYHRALAQMQPPLRARVGLHVGAVTLRVTPQADVALGAKPFEADGVSKPIAARVMSTALGGQTLLTKAAMDALGPVPQRSVSHGHWRVKGLPQLLELFEVGEDDAPFRPPPDAEKVYRVVRHGELWLPARETRHNLPAERDAFVGRGSHLNDLARRYDQGARLVSLLGIGGCGKTRLATRYGWTWMGDYPGGVWFCDLAPARTLEGLYSAVAQGLEVPLGQDDPVVQLGHAIAGRGRCLLILDNFEQLSRHAEATLGRWLERAGRAHFLVTSREVLGIPGEEALALAPLSAADAEALFLRRAAAARDDFDPSPDDHAAIATLAGLLDGLPLAIELAAARARTLTPRALLARMSERFKLLASSGGRHDRQATLRAAFDWSWDLLNAAEKVALAQLSVFEGGFTLEAVEGVLDLSTLPDAPWTVDVLNSLVDKSFVRPNGAQRFDMLVSVQAYADEHLRTEGRYPGSGPQALQAAQARHAAWFAALGPQRAVLGACADLDNLVVACRRATAAGDGDSAAGALEGAWAALSLRGPFSSAVELGEAVLQVPQLGAAARVRAQLALATALESLGRQATATALYEAALHSARQQQSLRPQVQAAIRLSRLHARAGATEQALQELDEALAWAQSLNDRALCAAALNFLGGVTFEDGQLDAASGHFEAALQQARAVGDLRLQGSLLGNLGLIHAEQGRMDPAQAFCEEALVISRQLGDLPRVGERLSALGMMCHLRGDNERALELSASALVMARELGYVRLECATLANIGTIRIARAEFSAAEDQLKAALTLALSINDARVVREIRGQLARLPNGAPAQTAASKPG